MLPESKASFKYKSTSEHGEVERISDLLGEYSEKLNSILNDFDHQRRRGLNIGWALIAVLGAVAEIWPILGTKNYSISLLPGIFVLSIYFLGLVIEGVRRYMRLRASAAMASNHLARVLRKVSQLEEHGERSLSERIELDLRLSEAEMLLHYAEKRVGAGSVL